MSVAALCRFVLSLLGRALPRDQREWAAAIRAEVDIPLAAREKIALTMSGALGLLYLAARGILIRWNSHSRTLALVVAYGLTVGYVDIISATRWPLRVLLVSGALACGIARPRVASVAGTLLGLSFLIELNALKGRDKLSGENVYSVLQY